MLAPLLAALSLCTSTGTYDSLPPLHLVRAEVVRIERDRRPSLPVDGCSIAAGELELAIPAGMAHVHEARSETLMAVPRGTSLELNNLAGTIVIQAWKRNDVRAVAEHGHGDRLVARLENGTLALAMAGRYDEPAFGDVSVNVPVWMALHLSSVESSINVAGVQAAIEAGSVRGDVVVSQSRGPMQLNSIEGDVRVSDTRGPVQVASVNNLVSLVRVVGLIDAESVNGDIQLSQVESPDVAASSVNGSVAFSGPFQPRGRYRLTSHRGNLRVGVPVGSAVDVSVANFNGAFRSGFPVQIAPGLRGRRFTFTLGGGGSSLELQSFDGLIQLLRDDASPVAPRGAAPGQAPTREERR
jgi:hypothetical protein